MAITGEIWQRGVVTPSSRIHDVLDHPVIDIDGHNVDFMPVFEEYVREFAGPRGIELLHREHPWFSASPAERERQHLAKRTWGFPTGNTVDHLTNIIPALLEERLSEMGLDFTIIYPSPNRIGVPHQRDHELRAPLCRALNTYQSDVLGPHAAHMTPAAMIPMDNPAEAMEELEYAIQTLGMKVIQMAAFCIRDSDGRGEWWDTLGLDSAYDYDPVWAKCLELKVAPSFHSTTIGAGPRRSHSNAVYNHVGHFATASESICKSLFLGGVTARFPDLKFVFLESGVGWAATLLADLVGHFGKRNVEALQNLTPQNLDLEIISDLIARYGSVEMQRHADRLTDIPARIDWPDNDDLVDWDDFAASQITSADDIISKFVPNFFFGCEGDDPMNVLAFSPALLPGGQRLNAVYGSDIGHWDVPRLDDVLHEAYELVEDGLITTDDFREFVFRNPAHLYTSTNADFFLGTAVEAAVADEVAIYPES